MYHSRTVQRDSTWDAPQIPESTNGHSERKDRGKEAENEDSRVGTPTPLRTIGDVQKALHPLQQEADRLGKQVEQFAETLDRLSKHKSKGPDCRHVLPLVQSYEQIAADTVNRLRQVHQRELRPHVGDQESSNVRSGESATGRSTRSSNSKLNTMSTKEDLQRWEDERQTWVIFGLLLQVRHPIRDPNHLPPNQDDKYLRPEKVRHPDPYDSERTVWKTYLAHDDEAWEQHIVTEWLKDCAESSGEDIDTLVAPLESGADRGSGLWAHGWLYSKEAIKGQKRLRSWPQPLDPAAQGLHLSLVNADRTQDLVTQLDPDAITRQGRHLEQEDLQFERATWLACWEMLRRGRSWSAICDWCQERVEGWRAVSMRGDPRASDDSMDTSASHKSRKLWRSMCAEAALHGVDSYENAVYGVLSGHLPSVERVAKTWNDYLFAYYNSALLHGFDAYVERTLDVRHERDAQKADPSTALILTGTPLVRKLMDTEIKTEGGRLLKSIQTSLICDGFMKFVDLYGVEVGRVSNEDSRSKVVDAETRGSEPVVQYALNFKDYDVLRIAAHILLVLKTLEPNVEMSYEAENVIVCYVDFLSRAGKQQLLPLYTSRLSLARRSHCMARQLPFILDSNERSTTIKLMRQYHFNIVHIFFLQLLLIVFDSRIPPELDGTFPALEMLDRTLNAAEAMESVIIHGFMGTEVRGDEMDLINGFDWFLLLDKHWKETMVAGCLVYKHLLRIGALAAARAFSQRASFKIISTSKTASLLGQTMDMSEPAADSDDDAPRSHEQRKKLKKEQDLLRKLAHTFCDLEALVLALIAFEEWQDVVVSFSTEMKATNDRSTTAKWKPKLQSAIEKLSTCVEPLLGSWLLYSADDAEASENHKLRQAYLPEVILAYNNALIFAGRAVSREYLLGTMDLAVAVAAEASSLASCVVEAKRMAELVTAFGTSGKMILLADEAAGSKGRKAVKLARRSSAEHLKIWSGRT